MSQKFQRSPSVLPKIWSKRSQMLLALIMGLSIPGSLSIVNRGINCALLLQDPTQTPFYCQCSSDSECRTESTLLFCAEQSCQCLGKGVTYLSGVPYNLKMEWCPLRTKCLSKIGSACTLKDYWYSSSVAKMECEEGTTCVPLSRTNQIQPHRRHHQLSPYSQQSYGSFAFSQAASASSGSGNRDGQLPGTLYYGVCSNSINNGEHSSPGAAAAGVAILNPNYPKGPGGSEPRSGAASAGLSVSILSIWCCIGIGAYFAVCPSSIRR